MFHCQHARTYRTSGQSAWLELCETCGEIVAGGIIDEPGAAASVPMMALYVYLDEGGSIVIDSGPKPSDVVAALLRSVPGVR